MRREVKGAHVLRFHDFFLDQELAPTVPWQRGIGAAPSKVAHHLELGLQKLEIELRFPTLAASALQISPSDEGHLAESAEDYNCAGRFPNHGGYDLLNWNRNSPGQHHRATNWMPEH